MQDNAGQGRKSVAPNLYAHVAHEVAGDGVPRALVHDFHADDSAAFGLEGVAREVLASKGGPAAPVGRLPAQLAVGIQAPEAPERQKHQPSLRLDKCQSLQPEC